jgi:hypothetical protein
MFYISSLKNGRGSDLPIDVDLIFFVCTYLQFQQENIIQFGLAVHNDMPDKNVCS